jgi:mannose-6-phosphate isomerase-like protein (cupin superfamily)
MAAYTIVERTEAPDMMEQYPGFGEMRFYTSPLGCEQLAFTWRSMPPDTGGRGSYGHRHRDQEEVYFVVKGTLTFKIGDDVVEVGPGSAVRVAADAYRSAHNDTDSDVELVICSPVSDDPESSTETTPDFW